MIFNTLNLGCKVNEYELDCIEQGLINAGHKKGIENVDIFVINTCSVTSVADQKSRQMIRKIKKNNPNLKCFAVMGCYSQHAAEFISKELDVDIVIGTKFRNKLVELIDKFLFNKEKILMIDSVNMRYEYESFNLIPNINKTRAYVKIQDGCNNFCSYCLIPYLRGRCRSRDKNEIIEEISSLVKKGYKEVVLVGIHTAGYGLDLENYTFSDLVEDILKEVPDLFRLRISSIEESEIDDKFINLIKNSDRIASHLHIPTQSGSTSVLKRMHRKYNTEDFLTKINRIREIRPDIAITTDLIVGFPGETNEEFNETISFINTVKFAEIHVFPFSSREGTLAAKMSDQVDSQIKKERVRVISELSKQLFKEFKTKFIGTEQKVIFETEKDGIWQGHTSNYLPFSLKTKENLKGEIVKVTYKL